MRSLHGPALQAFTARPSSCQQRHRCHLQKNATQTGSDIVAAYPRALVADLVRAEVEGCELGAGGDGLGEGGCPVVADLVL